MDHKTDEYASFESNDAYWGGAPKIKKLLLKFSQQERRHS